MNDGNSNSNPVRLLTHLPDSWLRLVTVIKHQANAGQFIYIEAPHGAGKTTFANILLTKLTVVDELVASYQKLHPLTNTQQILTEITERVELLPVVILDDAAEVDASVIEELISSNIGCFFVILAEPELVNRVPRLQNSRFNLPLFNKEDCHKLLTKMYHSSEANIEVPLLESELVYYESKGFPGDVVRLGQKLKDKLQRQSSGVNSFEIANRGIFSTVVLGLGFAIFLLYLFWPKSQTVSLQTQQTGTKEVVVEEQLPELEINQAALNSQVETGELVINEPKKPMGFTEWVASQNPDHYTIQLFSNSSKGLARNFKSELDLAESFIYSAEVKGVTAYRVVWGSYPNRARAQLAIQSLPQEMLAQKPWLRSFKAISVELTAQP